MIKQALLGAILMTAVIFAFVNAAQTPLAALLAAVLGAFWLPQEISERNAPTSLYFAVFVGLAVLGALSSAPLPILLVGLTTAIAAWDLSRFRQRIRESDEDDETALRELETGHLQKLALTVVGGLVIALLPALLTISVNFVVVLAIMLIVLLALRQSMLWLRGEDKNSP